MVKTTRIRLDRISSSTRNAQLANEVIVGDEIVAAEGYVLAVRILHDKSSYNTIEDLTGRMVALRAGDVLAGTLGQGDDEGYERHFISAFRTAFRRADRCLPPHAR